MVKNNKYSVKEKSILDLVKDVKDGLLDYKSDPSLENLQPTIEYFLKVTDKTSDDEILKFLCDENRKGSYSSGSQRITLLGDYHNMVVWLTNTNQM